MCISSGKLVCPFSPYTYIPNWSKSLDSPATITICHLWMWSSTVVTSLCKNHVFPSPCYSQIQAGFLKVKKREAGRERTIPDFNATLLCPICSLLLKIKNILDLYYRIFLLPNLSNKQFLQRVLTHSRIVWIRCLNKGRREAAILIRNRY